jgi:hypothetical protein
MTADAKPAAVARTAWRARLSWLVLALLVPALAFAVWRWRGATDELEIRAKGDFDLLVYVRRGQHVSLLDRFNRVVHPGEEIRFVLTGVPEEHSYVLVASVDGAGVATVYFPYGGTGAAPLPGPGRWEVPGSIVLDETLGPERVFAVFSKRPLTAADVEPALTRLGRAGKNAIRDAQKLDVPGTTQRSFLMFKQAQRLP